jgi:hypothetical protein
MVDRTKITSAPLLSFAVKLLTISVFLWSSVLLTIRFRPIREEFLIVAFNSPHPPKLLCVLCVEVLTLTLTF